MCLVGSLYDGTMIKGYLQKQKVYIYIPAGNQIFVTHWQGASKLHQAEPATAKFKPPTSTPKPVPKPRQVLYIDLCLHLHAYLLKQTYGFVFFCRCQPGTFNEACFGRLYASYM